MNLSFKAALGYALSCEPEARWHCKEIPDGYAHAGVDEVLPQYESLQFDISGPEDESTIGEVRGSIILWCKKYIVFLGSAPRPPPSPPRQPSLPPPASPHEEWDDHHSASPAPRQPTPPPPYQTKKAASQSTSNTTQKKAKGKK